MVVDGKLTWDEMCEFTSERTKGECYLEKRDDGTIILRKRGSEVGVPMDADDAADPLWLGDVLEDWRDWPDDD